jgi:hypothetical protein
MTRKGLFYPVRNSRLGQLILQMVDPTDISPSELFKRGYVIL